MSTDPGGSPTRRPRWRRPGWLFIYAAAALFLVAFALDAVLNRPAPKPAEEIALPASATALRNTILDRRLELARGDAFYLLLDVADSEIDLMYGGARLETYPLRKLEAGYRRGFLRRHAPPPDWMLRVYTEGAQRPPCRAEPTVVTAPAPGDSLPPPVIPPLPEEAFPAPDRWDVDFDGGLRLEVVAADSAATATPRESLAGAFRREVGEIGSALRGETIPRLRVVLTKEDAGRLYRGLPPRPSILLVF